MKTETPEENLQHSTNSLDYHLDAVIKAAVDAKELLRASIPEARESREVSKAVYEVHSLAGCLMSEHGKWRPRYDARRFELVHAAKWRGPKSTTDAEEG